MIVGDITELSIATVLDRGTPNRESIAIHVHERVNLGQYGIMLGTFAQSGMARPFQDNLFWFGDGFVEKGDWIFVNTGAGEPRKSRTNDQQNDVFSVFWNKRTTVFAKSNIVPILFRIDAVDIVNPPDDVPQISRSDKLLPES